MKRKQNRKGFTIVELVIVIAVIGILAAVLVPTFGNVIENANKSAALQEAKNIHTEYIAEKGTDGSFEVDEITIQTSNGYYVKMEDGKFETKNVTKVSGAVIADGTKILSKGANGLVYTCQGNAPSGNSKCSWCGNVHTSQG